MVDGHKSKVSAFDFYYEMLVYLVVTLFVVVNELLVKFRQKKFVEFMPRNVFG